MLNPFLLSGDSYGDSPVLPLAFAIEGAAPSLRVVSGFQTPYLGSGLLKQAVSLQPRPRPRVIPLGNLGAVQLEVRCAGLNRSIGAILTDPRLEWVVVCDGRRVLLVQNLLQLIELPTNIARHDVVWIGARVSNIGKSLERNLQPFLDELMV